MLSYTTVLQRNICKVDVKTISTIRSTVSTSKVRIYKGRKTAGLLNVAATLSLTLTRAFQVSYISYYSQCTSYAFTATALEAASCSCDMHASLV